MHIYLAGPMRGLPLHNVPAFDEAALQLRKRGHKVSNPVDHDREIGFDFNDKDVQPETLHNMFRWDLARVMECDAVVFLPGWSKSRGACAERVMAHYLGKPCFDYAAGALRPAPEYEEPVITWIERSPVPEVE